MKMLIAIAVLVVGMTANASLREQMLQDLKSDLQKSVRSTGREINVYHYGNRGPINIGSGSNSNSTKVINSDEAIELQRNGRYDSPVELEPVEAKQYFSAMTAQFSADQIKWNVGPGLYAAVDPVQSESYAGHPWFLLEITVPKGTRYLDVRPADGIMVSERFVKKWILRDNQDDFFYAKMSRYSKDLFMIHFTDLLQVPELHRMVVQALMELDVQMIVYAWNRHSVRICRERTLHDGQAFNFVNPNFLKLHPKLRVYTQDMGEVTADKRVAYSRVLDKLESADLEIYQGSTINNGVRSYYPVTGDSLLQAAKVRVLTSDWSRKLGRESLFAKLILKDFAQLDAILKRWTAGPGDQDVQVELSSNFKVKEHEENSYLSRQLYLNPMKSLSPAEYQRRLKLIESDTFGCSPDPAFAEENYPLAL